MERIRLEIGRVVAALPYHNHYVVRFHGEIGTVTAVSLDGAGAVRGGAKAGQAYMPGSAVFGAVFTENHPAYKFFACPHVILGALAEFPLHQGNANIVPRDIVLDSPSGYNFNQVYKNIINNEGVPTLNQDRSYNRATDSVPGDWYKASAMGGVILLSDFLTRIGASERCLLDFNAVDDTISGSFDGLDLDAEVARIRALNYGNELLRIDSDALTRNEALGVRGNLPPFATTEDTELDARVAPITEDQRGFFRHEEMAGGTVEGFVRALKSDFVSAPEDGVYKDGDVAYPGVLREDARMDGRYRLQAAKEIRLEKRFTIAVPYETSDDTPEDITYEVPDLYDREDAENAAGGVNGYADTQHIYQEGYQQVDSDTFQNASLKRRSGWKEPSQEELAQSLEAPSTPSIPELSDGADSYSLEDLASIIAEIMPGRRVRLFKNSSMFLQADDGSVSINDGYGAEIRMERGNITIASAGHIKFQPGRDMVEYVPRNKIVRARQRVEISSEKGSVSVKADENLHMLSGNSGVGSTVIENRAQNTNLTNTIDSQILSGDAVGSGVHIRSFNSGVSLLGDYIYGGGYANQAAKTEGLSPAACNILFDGGGGTAVIQGGTAAVVGISSASVALSGTVDGVYVASGSVSTVANSQITHTAAAVYLQGGGGVSVNKAFVNRNGVQTRRVTVPNFSPNLAVQGQITAGAGVAVQGSVSVTGDVGANGTIGRPQERVRVTVPTGSASTAVEIQAIGYESLQRYLTEAVGVQTEYGQAALEFAFPQATKDFRIPATRWQNMLDGGAEWEETPVGHRILEKDTYAYPGDALLANGVYMDATGIQHPYTINTRT